MLPAFFILHTSKKHAILSYGNPSKCVSEGERGEERERRRVLCFLMLRWLVRAYYPVPQAYERRSNIKDQSVL